MKNTVVDVPRIKQPIQEADGFMKLKSQRISMQEREGEDRNGENED